MILLFLYRFNKSARDDAKRYGNDEVVDLLDKFKKMALHRVCIIQTGWMNALVVLLSLSKVFMQTGTFC